MVREMCKSKIHRATVTDVNLNYVGSITIDHDLMDAADLLPYEKVQIANVSNGSRLETYVIPGDRGSGVIGINGAAARYAQVGDIIIILSYALMQDQEAREFEPKVVMVDQSNKIVRTDRAEQHGPWPPEPIIPRRH